MAYYSIPTPAFEKGWKQIFGSQPTAPATTGLSGGAARTGALSRLVASSPATTGFQDIPVRQIGGTTPATPAAGSSRLGAMVKGGPIGWLKAPLLETPAIGNAATGTGRLASTARAVGNVSRFVPIVAGVFAGVAEWISEINENNAMKAEGKNGKTWYRSGSNIAGAAVGGATGALAGAAIGTCFAGPVGTVVGFIAGGILGLVGASVGAEAGDFVGKAVETHLGHDAEAYVNGYPPQPQRMARQPQAMPLNPMMMDPYGLGMDPMMMDPTLNPYALNTMM